jgi:hypothetical protein
MRAIVFGVMLSLSALIAGRAFAGPSCDARVEKTKGQLVDCECDTIGTANQHVRIPQCRAKFQKFCTRAKTKGVCTVQSESCAQAQSEGDTFATQHCAGS